MIQRDGLSTRSQLWKPMAGGLKKKKKKHFDRWFVGTRTKIVVKQTPTHPLLYRTMHSSDDNKENKTANPVSDKSGERTDITVPSIEKKGIRGTIGDLIHPNKDSTGKGKMDTSAVEASSVPSAEKKGVLGTIGDMIQQAVSPKKQSNTQSTTAGDETTKKAPEHIADSKQTKEPLTPSSKQSKDGRTKNKPVEDSAVEHKPSNNIKDTTGKTSAAEPKPSVKLIETTAAQPSDKKNTDTTTKTPAVSLVGAWDQEHAILVAKQVAADSAQRPQKLQPAEERALLRKKEAAKIARKNATAVFEELHELAGESVFNSDLLTLSLGHISAVKNPTVNASAGLHDNELSMRPFLELLRLRVSDRAAELVSNLVDAVTMFAHNYCHRISSNSHESYGFGTSFPSMGDPYDHAMLDILRQGARIRTTVATTKTITTTTPTIVMEANETSVNKTSKGTTVASAESIVDKKKSAPTVSTPVGSNNPKPMTSTKVLATTTTSSTSTSTVKTLISTDRVEVFVSRIDTNRLKDVEKGFMGMGHLPADKNDVYVKLKLSIKEKELKTAVRNNAGETACYDYEGADRNSAKTMKWETTVGELLRSGLKLDVSVWDENWSTAHVCIGTASPGVTPQIIRVGGTDTSESLILEQVRTLSLLLFDLIFDRFHCTFTQSLFIYLFVVCRSLFSMPMTKAKRAPVPSRFD